MIYVIYFPAHKKYYQKRRNALPLTDNCYACEHYSSERTARMQAEKLMKFPYNMSKCVIRRFTMTEV